MGYSYDYVCYGRQSLKLKPKAKRTRNPESDETVAFSIIKKEIMKNLVYSIQSRMDELPALLQHSRTRGK